MPLIRKCAITLSTIGLLFALINSYVGKHISDCSDCAIKWGVPFPFRQSEGFATSPHFLWLGLMQDFALVLGVVAVVVLVWKVIERR